MKKLDNGDKMIIASVILAIGITISAYFIANPKSELQQCVDTYLEIRLTSVNSDALRYCTSMIRGK